MSTSTSFEEPAAVPGQVQPWRTWWPPKDLSSMTDNELKAKPWINWKPNPSKPNEKPWLQWVPRGAHLHDHHCDSGQKPLQPPGPPPPSPPSPTPNASSNAEGG